MTYDHGFTVTEQSLGRLAADAAVTDEWWVWLPTLKLWQCLSHTWLAVLHVGECRKVRLGTREEAASW